MLGVGGEPVGTMQRVRPGGRTRRATKLLLLLFGFLFFHRRNDDGGTGFSWSAFWSRSTRRSRWTRCRGRRRHRNRNRLNHRLLCFLLCPLASVQSNRGRNDCCGHQPASHVDPFLLWVGRILEHDLYLPAVKLICGSDKRKTRKTDMNRFILCTALCLLTSSALAAEIPDTVFIEEMTWTEVRDAIKAGKTTIIFPTGGTEQNGPHMVLGKHNFIVKHAAEQIARRLGNALVAPVLAYVPEGSIDPPRGHMQYPGTISLPDDVFIKVTEYATRSFRANGFKDIVLIGDSGENQKGLQSAANSLNKEWSKTNVRVHFVPEYYKESPFREWLQGQGEKREDIGTHAGTSTHHS